MAQAMMAMINNNVVLSSRSDNVDIRWPILYYFINFSQNSNL
jgi:hypothetical protein